MKAREHAEQVLAHHVEDRHSKLANLLNADPKTLVGIHASNWTWMLGYPDEAVRVSDAKDVHARRRGHAFDLGFALTVGAEVFDYRGEPEELRKRTDETERLGRENEMPFLWAVLAPSAYGVAMIHAGQVVKGMTALKTALDLLAPVYNWFTEGFDTKDLKDLKDGKALLAELTG